MVPNTCSSRGPVSMPFDGEEGGGWSWSAWNLFLEENSNMREKKKNTCHLEIQMLYKYTQTFINI